MSWGINDDVDEWVGTLPTSPGLLRPNDGGFESKASRDSYDHSVARRFFRVLLWSLKSLVPFPLEIDVGL